jgi:hypothetical protein
VLDDIGAYTYGRADNDFKLETMQTLSNKVIMLPFHVMCVREVVDEDGMTPEQGDGAYVIFGQT